MSGWIKVVTHPLGLTGFALSLLFAYLAKAKKSAERRWLAPTAVCAALAVLAGGLTLAYIQISKTVVPSVSGSKAATQQQGNQVQQTTSGAASPNVQGVQGDVTITVGPNTGEPSPKKPAEKKPVKKSE